MKLKDWRKKKKLSQAALAAQLEIFASEKSIGKIKRLRQNTIGYWERGTLPRSGWLVIITEFTKGQVTAGDFVITTLPVKMKKLSIDGRSMKLPVVRFPDGA